MRSQKASTNMTMYSVHMSVDPLGIKLLSQYRSVFTTVFIVIMIK